MRRPLAAAPTKGGGAPPFVGSYYAGAAADAAGVAAVAAGVADGVSNQQIYCGLTRCAFYSLSSSNNFGVYGIRKLVVAFSHGCFF